MGRRPVAGHPDRVALGHVVAFGELQAILGDGHDLLLAALAKQRDARVPALFLDSLDPADLVGP